MMTVIIILLTVLCGFLYYQLTSMLTIASMLKQRLDDALRLNGEILKLNGELISELKKERSEIS